MSARRPSTDAAVVAHLARAVLAAKPLNERDIRWRVIKRVFHVSRGEAIALCRSVDADPFVWVHK